MVPLCRQPLPRLCGLPRDGLRWSQSSVQSNPLFGFRSPVESCPAIPSRPAAAHQLLSWTLAPFSTHRSGGPLSARFPHLATFRLQGLVTLLAVSSLRTPAGFVSRRRRSWDSPFGAFPSREVSGASPPGRTHLPFPPADSPGTRRRRVGPAGRGSWALPLPRVPGARRRD
jgi:hypothetical protein